MLKDLQAILAGKIVESSNGQFAYGCGTNQTALSSILNGFKMVGFNNQFNIDEFLTSQAEGNFGDLTKDENGTGERLTHTQIAIQARFAKSKTDHSIKSGCQFFIFYDDSNNQLYLVAGGKSKTFGNEGINSSRLMYFLETKLLNEHNLAINQSYFGSLVSWDYP
jgi:hypothetical protein